MSQVYIYMSITQGEKLKNYSFLVKSIAIFRIYFNPMCMVYVYPYVYTYTIHIGCVNCLMEMSFIKYC